MAEISVTDIQRMLRDHADFGHDVISDPRAVYLGNLDDVEGTKKPYPLPVRHALLLNPKTLKSSALASWISHGENPSLTYVRSLAPHVNGESVTNSRITTLEHPWHVHHSDGDHRHSFLAQDHPKLVSWGDSIHDIIAEHRKTSPTYAVHSWKDNVREFAGYTSTNETGWDPVKALHEKARPLEPFSGMVVISSSDDFMPKGVYNPATEQLHPIVRK